MDTEIIVLSGSPASGKDTITKHLAELSHGKLIHFQKHRSYVSPNERKDSYINVAENVFISMINENAFFQYHQRYDRYYGISYEMITHYKNSALTPIIHNGQLRHLDTILNKKEYNILSILIWTPLEDVYERLKLRHRDDAAQIPSRYSKAVEEFRELIAFQENLPFDLVIRNTDLQKTTSVIIDRVNKNSVENNNGMRDLKQYLNTLKL